jgi:hypothetical protein
MRSEDDTLGVSVRAILVVVFGVFVSGSTICWLGYGLGVGRIGCAKTLGSHGGVLFRITCSSEVQKCRLP